VSCDIYPDPEDPLADMDAAFTHDLMRSLGGGRPWLVMEQAPSAVDWRPLNVPQDPAVVRRRSLQAIGAGADGIMFFQWRGSRSGPEMLHSAMLPAGGRDAPGWRSTERLGGDLARLAEITGSRCVPAEVALLIDWESWWALEQDGHPTDALRFRDLALRVYAPFREANVPLDMRRPEDDLSAYRVVAVPNLFLMSTAAVANLTKFVRGGGIALVGPFSGIVDPNYELPGGSHPAHLRDLLGITVSEWWPLPEGHVDISFDDGSSHRGSIWRDAIELSTAVSVARFSGSDALGRRPAITRNHLGDGQAWYLGTIPDHAAMATVVGEVLSQGGVDPLGSTPAGVELLKREADSVSFLFVVNRGDRDVAVPLHAVAGMDLLTGSTVSRLLHLGPQGVAIVKSHH
jgi:beta-galactosidase